MTAKSDELQGLGAEVPSANQICILFLRKEAFVWCNLRKIYSAITSLCHPLSPRWSMQCTSLVCQNIALWQVILFVNCASWKIKKITQNISSSGYFLPPRHPAIQRLHLGAAIFCSNEHSVTIWMQLTPIRTFAVNRAPRSDRRSLRLLRMNNCNCCCLVLSRGWPQNKTRSAQARVLPERQLISLVIPKLSHTFALFCRRLHGTNSYLPSHVQRGVSRSWLLMSPT